MQNAYDIVPLMGNHEVLLLDAFNNKKNTSKWIQNGGDATLKSFEINILENIKSKYIHFFKNLKYYYSYKDCLFVHAGFNDNIINPFIDYYSMLWKCNEVYVNPIFTNKTIVHGHNPISVSKCEERVNSKCDVINIDTGCVYKDRVGFGKLTAYEYNNGRLFSV